MNAARLTRLSLLYRSIFEAILLQFHSEVLKWHSEIDSEKLLACEETKGFVILIPVGEKLIMT